MSDLNLNSLSLDELKNLEASVEKEIQNCQERQKAEALAKAEAAAQEFGFSLSELISSKEIKKGVRIPKYQHPENPSLTWTGKGRKPKWISEMLQSGRQLEEFKI